MQLVRSGFRDDVDDAAAIVAELGVEVIGEDAKFRDGVEIRDDGSPAVHQFLHVAAIHHEAVCILALTTDGLVPGIQTARRRDGHGRASHYDRIRKLRRNRNNSGLKRQQIGETPSVERNSRHFAAGDHLPKLRAGAFHVDFGNRVADGYFLGAFGELQSDVLFDCRIGVHHQAGALFGAEAARFEQEIIGSDGDAREGIFALAVGCGLRLDTLGRIRQPDRHARNATAAGIGDGSRDPASDGADEVGTTERKERSLEH